MNNKNDAYDLINELYEKKLKNETDEKKRKSLERFFRKKYCFFQVDANTALKILYYLGVPKEELMDVYSDLISLSNYQKYMPEVRTILPDASLLKKD